MRSCRDVNNKNYASSINYLINKKIPVIRFVHNNSESVKSFDSKFYYEYLVDDDASKTVQYYLIKNSKFIICTQSGIMNFNSILDVPFSY